MNLKKLFQNFFYKTSKYSQAGQDLFALELFGDEGSYIDIGAGVPIKDNNTYKLEVEYNWKGYSIEISEVNKDLWKNCKERKNKIYWADALTFDYKKAIIENNLNSNIDFLSCDIDPQEKTFLALKKLINDGIKPKLITFETDFYREQKDYSILAYDFLKPFGYKYAVKNVYSNLKKRKIFETWFIKSDIKFETIDYSKWVKKNVF
jgi:hypothetical protein